jgi:hypothetical protein
MKEKCRGKIAKMEDIIQGREWELRSLIQKRLSVSALKIEKEKERCRNEEEIFRKEWEKIIAGKLQAEFSAASSSIRREHRLERKQKILEVIGELEVKTRLERTDLNRRIEKEKKEHEIYLNRLRKRLADAQSDLEEAKSELRDEFIDNEIEELKKSLANCKCAVYREKLTEIQREITEVNSEFEKEGIRTVNLEHEQKLRISELKTSLAEVNEMNKVYYREVGALENELKGKKEEVAKRIRVMEENHKQQIREIGDRVKQTVKKKDEVIDELKGKIEQFGKFGDP